ncbi:hypothetical protein O181_043495 [Austropuccinia psidii MF-1]|uniref:Uncharacterized protein n=1 Tax=Austropuccinia psidii MF-1 TaxID=1389203 RepID=A0A9Q3DMP0_9BASI|nr:hypothetical protein [Austropuccinia psidii MF-1]
MELCTCPNCRKYTVTSSNGKNHQGLFVEHSTRIQHWEKALAKEDENFINNQFTQISLDDPNKHSRTYSITEKEPHSNTQESKAYNNDSSMSNIIILVLQFIMWLYLVCGLSRDNCRKARDMILNIIQLISQKAIKHNSLLSRVPCDICTMSKRLKLEFSFEEQVCCQKCYSLYGMEIAPELCIYQPTIASNKCYNNVFHPHKIHPFPQIYFSSTAHNSKHRHVEGGQI